MSKSPILRTYAIVFHDSKAAYVGCTKNLAHRITGHRNSAGAVGTMMKLEDPEIRVIHEGEAGTMHGKELEAYITVKRSGYKMLNVRPPLELVLPSSRNGVSDSVVLTVQVTEETLRRLDALARREGRTRSWAARELIERSIRRLRLPADETAAAP